MLSIILKKYLVNSTVMYRLGNTQSNRTIPCWTLWDAEL